MRAFRPLTALAACLLFCLAAPSALRAAALALEGGRSVYPVRDVQLIVDKDHALSLEEIRRMEAQGKAPWAKAEKLNFGYSKARYWLKVELAGLSAEEQNWVLEFGYPMIQVLQVHRFDGTAGPVSCLTGRLTPFGSRPIAYRNFLFNFSTRKGSRTVFYLMLESSGTLLAPMTVYSQHEFLGRSTRTTAGIGLYCGVILAMVLFNFFLLITTRDSNYLYYIAYALTFCLLMGTLNGMTYQYLWPELVGWNRVSVPVLAGVCYLFLVLFTRSFLETRRFAPRLEWGLGLILAGALFLIGGGLFHYGLVVNRFTSFFISAAPLVVLPISLWCLRKGSKAAGYYSVAFGFFFIGAALRAARDLAWIQQGLFTDYGAYFGSAAEMLILSLGLAARIRLLKEEKLKSELHALEAESKLADSRRELEGQLAISSLAAQVAHDIRSPLAALGAAAKGLALPGEQREVISNAVGRMQSIADDLLDRYRAPGAAAKTRMEPRELAGLIAQVVSEKELQHKDKAGIKIIFDGAEGLRAVVEAREFQRLMSNLINNSVEALEHGGTVSVGLSSSDGKALITVKDDGKGVSPEILAKLCRKGETHGKAGGTGLGLYHAHSTVKNWGGGLRLESLLGKGSSVLIELPLAAERTAPKTAVLLDDDQLVHMNWKMAARSSGVQLMAYTTLADLSSGITSLPKDTPLYIDSELGENIRGEDIVVELKNNGFTDITMATGLEPEKFAHLPWLKVTGKEPPWGE